MRSSLHLIPPIALLMIVWKNTQLLGKSCPSATCQQWDKVLYERAMAIFVFLM